MNDLDELVEIGEKIIVHFENLKNNEPENSDIYIWSADSVLSARILLDFLRSDILEIEKIKFLAELIGERHKLARPFSILYWCNKILAFIDES